MEKLIMMLIAVMVVAAEACTGMYAGKETTTDGSIRVIGTTKQGNCHVLQLDCRETMPERMRGTVWSCLG